MIERLRWLLSWLVFSLGAGMMFTAAHRAMSFEHEGLGFLLFLAVLFAAGAWLMRASRR